MPSFMNRSCQRQTQVFDLPVRRMISLVPTPSALERMIAARQACFCEALRSLVIASSRPRTDRVIVMEIPVRMRPPEFVSVTVQEPGFSYTAKPDFEGQDAFTIQVTGTMVRMTGTSDIQVTVSVAK